jgi:hypothetical protein
MAGAYSLQVVWPFSLNEDWRLISYTILPVLQVPVPGESTKAELGDTLINSSPLRKAGQVVERKRPPAANRCAVYAWESEGRSHLQRSSVTDSDGFGFAISLPWTLRTSEHGPECGNEVVPQPA